MLTLKCTDLNKKTWGSQLILGMENQTVGEKKCDWACGMQEGNVSSGKNG